jgi:transposase InsO family protein
LLKWLILQSDRGSQYASQAFQECLLQYGVVQSKSRLGNCYENVLQESFYKSFKVEDVCRRDYETHEEATRGVRDTIDRFYNCERLHSSLGFVSPADYDSLRM